MYNDTPEKRKGSERELEVIPLLKNSISNHYHGITSIKESSNDENMKDKIDYFITIHKNNGEILEFAADFKAGASITLKDEYGRDFLSACKSDYIIEEKGSRFIFYSVNSLRRLTAKYPPKLIDSWSNPGSKYIWLGTYVSMHQKDLLPGDRFEIRKKDLPEMSEAQPLF